MFLIYKSRQLSCLVHYTCCICTCYLRCISRLVAVVRERPDGSVYMCIGSKTSQATCSLMKDEQKAQTITYFYVSDFCLIIIHLATMRTSADSGEKYIRVTIIYYVKEYIYIYREVKLLESSQPST